RSSRTASGARGDAAGGKNSVGAHARGASNADPRGRQVDPRSTTDAHNRPTDDAAGSRFPRERLRRWMTAHPRGILVAGAVLLVAAFVAFVSQRGQEPRVFTQHDIDQAVLHALESNTLPSPAARAWKAISSSVVRVRALDPATEEGAEVERNVGTGVVIVDTRTILTNLHVVVGAPRLEVEFADGSTSEARIAGLEPAQDLAVLQAKTTPDDLKAATMRSTSDLSV